MFGIKELIWMLPVIFIIHDMEEIIFAKTWIDKSKHLFENKKIKPFGEFISTESFSVAVLEELIIVTGVTLYSSLTHNYIVWWAMSFVVVVHFVPHIVSIIIFKGFVPGVCTSFILLPIGVYMLVESLSLFEYTVQGLIISSIIVTVIFLVNLKWLHKMMPLFDKVINKI